MIVSTSFLLQMIGAICVDSGRYTLPTNASRTSNYICPDCTKQVILKQGNIRIHHFAHKSETSSCTYYVHPSESQIHKDSKLKLSEWLKNKKELQLHFGCQRNNIFGKCGRDNYHQVVYLEGDDVVLEFRGQGYVADVALVNGGKVRYIFELKHTHATMTTVRPEPWYEIDCKELLESLDECNQEKDDRLWIQCIRTNCMDRVCEDCLILDRPWINIIPLLDHKVGIEGQWRQEKKCIHCGICNYNPVFMRGFRQVCKLCLFGGAADKIRRSLTCKLFEDE